MGGSVENLRTEVERLADRTAALDETAKDNGRTLDDLHARYGKVLRRQFVLIVLAAVLACSVLGVGAALLHLRAFLCDSTAVLTSGTPSTPNGARVQEQTRDVRERYWC